MPSDLYEHLNNLWRVLAMFGPPAGGICLLGLLVHAERKARRKRGTRGVRMQAKYERARRRWRKKNALVAREDCE